MKFIHVNALDERRENVDNCNDCYYFKDGKCYDGQVDDGTKVDIPVGCFAGVPKEKMETYINKYVKKWRYCTDDESNWEPRSEDKDESEKKKRCTDCEHHTSPATTDECVECLGYKTSNQKEPTGATRENSTGQGRWDLLPMQALDGVAKVLEKGAEKYDTRNWEKGLPSSSYISHAMRHLGIYISQKLGLKRFSGEDITKEPHLYHAICNLLMLAETEARVDDGVLPAELKDYKGE